jgi:hypothetical protein
VAVDSTVLPDRGTVVSRPQEERKEIVSDVVVELTSPEGYTSALE